MKINTLLLFVILCTPAFSADPVKIPALQVDGTFYMDATITPDPDGIQAIIRHSKGIARVSIDKIPQSVLARINYTRPTETSVAKQPTKDTDERSPARPEAVPAPESSATPPAATTTAQPGKIDGAFGKKLGGIFNPAGAIGTSQLTDGTPMYQFSPEKPFRSFTRYYVLITPTTHKIYAIWGIGDVENTETGKKEQTLLTELLEKKYGVTEKRGVMDSLLDRNKISHGSRYAMTKVTGIIDVAIEIRYHDGDLEAEAEKERLAIEGKKVDASGL